MARRRSAAPSASAIPAPKVRAALAEYRTKRDFSRTAEPSGDAPRDEVRGPSGDHRFVVQRHRARRLHYDVRLELDGVLVSWAVPKGPSLDPAAKRLAVHVEDHPIEYFDFEGVIPRGEYGGGDVIVWDWGTWRPLKDTDPASDLAKGELMVELTGEKLRGEFVFIRSGSDRSGKEQWLMFHRKGEHTVEGWDAEDHPRSVLSGRTNDEVAADPEFTWNSDAPAARARTRVHDTAARERAIWEPPTKDELAALDRLGKKGVWTLQGVDLHLTNLDKVLFPALGKAAPITKRDFIRYHACIAPLMLPYLEGRAVNLHRYPDGAGKPGFWNKAVPDWAPDWITTWEYEDAKEGDTKRYFVLDNVPALAWMANYGAIELHPWTSRTDAAHLPTYALFDIDPGPATTWDEVLVLARLIRAALDHLGIVGRPKTTGKRGIQVWVPIERGPTFDETTGWVETVSRAVGQAVPELVSWEWRVKERKGKARLDYTQNAINKTLVAPYSARPAAGGPVSAPIEWDELDDPKLRPDRWTLRTILRRVAQVGDLFEPVVTTRQKMPGFE